MHLFDQIWILKCVFFSCADFRMPQADLVPSKYFLLSVLKIIVLCNIFMETMFFFRFLD